MDLNVGIQYIVTEIEKHMENERREIKEKMPDKTKNKKENIKKERL
ncbi:MAG: hypothetical protein PHD41_07705 [Methanosarcinaceae archaeon]|nr:hypothetical protein [Methanosarcinaceae archaeon]MDD4332298.1 hypothetical protein [Methanosarcinaceae archaeon]MDD4749509.1 hypothetical protein [Methanosarcinaceae archaeon]